MGESKRRGAIRISSSRAYKGSMVERGRREEGAGDRYRERERDRESVRVK